MALQTEPLVDHRGTTITEGMTVAYNLSGEIAMGVVTDIRPAIKDGYMYAKRAIIKVRCEFPRGNKGKVSIVKSPKNVMVIRERDDDEDDNLS